MGARIHLAACAHRTPLSEAGFQQGMQQLSVSQQAVIMRYLRQEDRELKLLGALLARHVVQCVAPALSLESFFEQWQAGATGKPFVAGAPEFNYSHCKGLVIAAALSSGQIGVDAEAVLPLALSDFERFFTAKEMQDIRQAADPLRTFYQWWTLKESVMKADGRGMSLHPQSVRVLGNRAQVESKIWRWSRLDVGDGHEACVTISEEAEWGNVEWVEAGWLCQRTAPF